MQQDISLSGQLREAHLPALLHALYRKQVTGVLCLSQKDLEKSLYLKEGEIVFAASKYRGDRLGMFLLKSGKITFSQYERTVHIYQSSAMKAGKRQGTVFVEQGFLTSRELYDAVIQQVKEIALSLFLWVEGEYRFSEGPLLPDQVITLKISTANLILEGIRRIPDWIRLADALPPFEHRLRLTSDPRDLFQSIDMAPSELCVLRALQGRSIRDVLNSAIFPPFETLKLIYFFFSAGIVESSESHREEIESITQRIVAGELHQRSLHKGPESTMGIREVRDAYKKMEYQNFYEILGLTSDSSCEEIQKAYYRLAKSYHPDRYLEEEMSDVKKELEGLFSKIKEAYETLTTPEKRLKHDADLPQRHRTSQ